MDISWTYHTVVTVTVDIISRRSDVFTYCYARLVAAIVLIFILIPVDNTFKPSIDT